MEHPAAGMDIAYLARRAAREHPTRLAVDDGKRRLTTRGLLEHAERLANALDALKVPIGARVGILSENRSEYIEVDLGIAVGRRIRVALNSRMALDDFRYCLSDAGAQVLVHSSNHLEAATRLADELGLHLINLDAADGSGYSALLSRSSASVVDRSGTDEDAAWITYTSGTTGKPKGVTLSHRAIREVTMNLLLELGPKSKARGIVLTQALSHGAGYFVLPYLLVGGCLRVLGKFDPEEVAALAGDPSLGTLKIVPAMLPPLLEVRQAFRFETIVYGASPINLPVLEASLERFGPVLMQVYGQSECPVTLTLLDKEGHLHAERRRSAGRPWPTVAVEVRAPDGHPVPAGEHGEVTVTGPQLMSGYWGMPEATGEVIREGWLWTRDMGWCDDSGYLYLVGRSDEMINSGGYNISPREVERVMLEHPGVSDCAVVGVPDERWGSAVCAIVLPRADLDLEELTRFARARLGFRAPKRVVAVPEIPTNAYGKVDRAEVLAALTKAAR